jgi:hypothetical protein
MSNDIHQPKPIQQRFSDALSELVCMCIEAGMHTSEMIGPLEAELKWARDASRDPPMPKADQ